MTPHRRTSRVRHPLAVVFALTIMTAAWSSGEARTQDGLDRTLTIFTGLCPANYAGAASADECDDAPMMGVAFRVGRPYTDFFMTARTDDEGVVAFEITGLPLRGTIRVIEELPPQTARIVAYCIDQSGPPLQITYVAMPGNVPPIMVADVAVGETADVRCDWYNVALE